MAVDIKGDTDRVREEFDGLSNATQVFIWTLVGLGVVIGLLLGGAIAYGVAVEEVDGRDCIELDDTLYCAEDGAAAGTTDTDTTTDTDEDADDDGLTDDLTDEDDDEADA
jgi:hypothetical protein